MGGKQTPEVKKASYEASRERHLAKQKLRRDSIRAERDDGAAVTRAASDARLQIIIDKLAVLSELLAFTERRDDMAPQAKFDIIAGSIRLLDREDRYWRSLAFKHTSVKALAVECAKESAV